MNVGSESVGLELRDANVLAEPLDRSFLDFFLSGQDGQQAVGALAQEHLSQSHRAWSLANQQAEASSGFDLGSFSRQPWSDQLACQGLEATVTRLLPHIGLPSLVNPGSQPQQSSLPASHADPALQVWPLPIPQQTSRQTVPDQHVSPVDVPAASQQDADNSSGGSGVEASQAPAEKGRRGAKPTKAQMEAKLKEKNKRAQKRFRDRQKSRLQESERQVSELSAKLNALLVDHNRLASRNSILEKVVALQQDSHQGSVSRVQGGLREPFVPGKPWNPAALLTVSVRAQPVTFTAQQIRDMPWREHSKLYKEYVDELGTQLLATHGSRQEAAVVRIGELVKELTFICSLKANFAPHHMRAIHLHTLDGSAADIPNRAVWSSILGTLQLTNEQRMALLELRQRYFDNMAHIVRTRVEIDKALQAAENIGRSSMEASMSYVHTHNLMQRLADNQRETTAANAQLMGNVYRKLWTPLQSAAVLVQSYPWAPDVLEMLHALAALEGEPSQDELLAAAAAVKTDLQPRETSGGEAAVGR